MNNLKSKKCPRCRYGWLEPVMTKDGKLILACDECPNTEEILETKL